MDGLCPQEKECVFSTSPLPNGQNVGVTAGAGAATVGRKTDTGQQDRAWSCHGGSHHGAAKCKRNPSHPRHSDLCHKNQTYILTVNSYQGCILSPCLFNLYTEYLMGNTGLEEAQAGIKIVGKNINNLSYADAATAK